MSWRDVRYVLVEHGEVLAVAHATRSKLRVRPPCGWLSWYRCSSAIRRQALALEAKHEQAGRGD